MNTYLDTRYRTINLFTLLVMDQLVPREILNYSLPWHFCHAERAWFWNAHLNLTSPHTEKQGQFKHKPNWQPHLLTLKLNTRSKTSSQIMATLNDLPLELKFMIIDEISALQHEVTVMKTSSGLPLRNTVEYSLDLIGFSLSSSSGSQRKPRPTEELRQIRHLIEAGTNINDLACLAKVNQTFHTLLVPYIAKAIAEGVDDKTAQRFFLHTVDVLDLGTFLRKLNPIGRSRIKQIWCSWNMNNKDENATIRSLTDATTFALIKKDCLSLQYCFVKIRNLSRFRTESRSDVQYDVGTFDKVDGFKEFLELEQSLKRKEGRQSMITNVVHMEDEDLLAFWNMLQEAKEKYKL